MNKLYSFYILQPRLGKDCYRFIRDNFHQLNGKIYRPRTKSNYLVLALMKQEGREIEHLFGTKTKAETVNNDAMLNSLQSHFHVSRPLELDADLSVDNIPNVGTLEEQPCSGVDGNTLVLVGAVKNSRHWEWIKDGKYNIRVMTPKVERDGAVMPTRQLLMVGKILLYPLADLADMPEACLFDLADPESIPTTYDSSEMRSAGYPFEEGFDRNNRYLVYEINTQSFFSPSANQVGANVNRIQLESWISKKHAEATDEFMRAEGAPIVTTIQELSDNNIIVGLCPTI